MTQSIGSTHQAQEQFQQLIGFTPGRSIIYKRIENHGVGYKLPPDRLRLYPERLNAILTGQTAERWQG